MDSLKDPPTWLKVATTQEIGLQPWGPRQWTSTTTRWRCGLILLPSLTLRSPHPQEDTCCQAKYFDSKKHMTLESVLNWLTHWELKMTEMVENANIVFSFSFSIQFCTQRFNSSTLANKQNKMKKMSTVYHLPTSIAKKSHHSYVRDEVKCFWHCRLFMFTVTDYWLHKNVPRITCQTESNLYSWIFLYWCTCKKNVTVQSVGLVQVCSISIVNALEIWQACNDLSK